MVFSSFKCSIIFFYPNHLPIITGLKLRIVIDRLLPLISDYTRKSIAAFEKYPNVGLLVCLGEAMDTYEDDVYRLHKPLFPE